MFQIFVEGPDTLKVKFQLTLQFSFYNLDECPIKSLLMVYAIT